MAKGNSRKIFGVILLIAAVLFAFLAWQCVTTVEYGLYSTNYSYYVEKAADCTAKAAEYQTMATGTYADQYALMAQNMQTNAQSWQDSAKNAKDYLTWHRVGCGSLIVLAVLSVIFGIRFLTPAKKKETPVNAGEQKVEKSAK